MDVLCLLLVQGSQFSPGQLRGVRSRCLHKTEIKQHKDGQNNSDARAKKYEFREKQNTEVENTNLMQHVQSCIFLTKKLTTKCPNLFEENSQPVQQRDVLRLLLGQGSHSSLDPIRGVIPRGPGQAGIEHDKEGKNCCDAEARDYLESTQMFGELSS